MPDLEPLVNSLTQVLSFVTEAAQLIVDVLVPIGILLWKREGSSKTRQLKRSRDKKEIHHQRGNKRKRL